MSRAIPTAPVAVLLLALLVAGVLSLMIGHAGFAPLTSLGGLIGDPATQPAALIVQEIRLPRLLVGMAVGASLGISGAALQGLLRNPLADPGVIGVSASAGLGAVIAIYYGAASLNALAVPGFAMAGALVSTSLLYLLARRDSSVMTLILVGIGLSALAGALTSLVMNFSPNPFALSNIVMWLLGSLANRSFTDLWLALPFMAAGWLCLGLSGPALRALSLGEDTAASMGVNLLALRALVVVGAALSVGASVAVSGAIGFVGLIVPHILRPFVGHDPGRLLAPSAVGGALLITLADIAVRLAPTTQQELKLGVLTALIGAPFFLFLVLKTRREMR